MTYNVVQPQKTKNGMRYYLYEVTAEWDPEKKRSRQKRRYLGPCDGEGNLIKEPVKVPMNCRRCGKDGRYWNDTIDPENESKLLFYLCKDCQKKLFSMIGGFLEARE